MNTTATKLNIAVAQHLGPHWYVRPVLELDGVTLGWRVGHDAMGDIGLPLIGATEVEDWIKKVRNTGASQ